ncbi:hypothetical protein BIV60_15420 [Bacillus sp. MUM 116]|uniref:hypothetical protein n=1 Tax=Bacillus sp. MUM 116 TaxID=1678002 RepID=UPI0008F5C8DE|nr:hypothetical protein [Bacillus sp. MUM 116]OIK12912.1 hypothetical protein BIV60_15420 [Bacillus sp. MUM 116]
MKIIENKSQGIILGFLIISVSLMIVIAYNAFAVVSRVSNQSTNGNTAQTEINAQDTQIVKDITHSFFANFKKGVPLNEHRFTDITYQYFTKDFLENTFPMEKSKLFGIYGYGKLTHSYTTVDGLQEEGGIKSFEITSIRKDNVNNIVTVYVRMDALEPNTVQWIEWRNVPSEGWKINAISFNGNIEELNQ